MHDPGVLERIGSFFLFFLFSQRKPVLAWMIAWMIEQGNELSALPIERHLGEMTEIGKRNTERSPMVS